MSDYKSKLEEWPTGSAPKSARAGREFDIRGRVEEGARVAHDAVRQGAETIGDGAGRAREEAERWDREYEISEKAREAAERSCAARTRGARCVSCRQQVLRGDRAGRGAFEGAKTYYERASKVVDAGARLTRASTAAGSGLLKATGWIKENPGKTALGDSVPGAWRACRCIVPGLDAVLIGSHPHWLTHSALPVYGLRKVSEKFDSYLRENRRPCARMVNLKMQNGAASNSNVNR